jgi:outer membrane biosynthesis protein TonB
MRYCRLLVVSLLLTLSITGCHHKPERALPPPHAQAPVIIPPPTLPQFIPEPVILAQSQPAPPVTPPPVVAPPHKKRAARVRHHHAPAKGETQGESPETQTAAGNAPAPSAPGTAVIGQLSADDATVSPSDASQTKHLIDSTENKLKKLSTNQQAEHKDSIAQVGSFLSQARQALSMNDLVGAQTLANKAKILLDELSK